MCIPTTFRLEILTPIKNRRTYESLQHCPAAVPIVVSATPKVSALPHHVRPRTWICICGERYPAHTGRCIVCQRSRFVESDDADSITNSIYKMADSVRLEQEEHLRRHGYHSDLFHRACDSYPKWTPVPPPSPVLWPKAPSRPSSTKCEPAESRRYHTEKRPARPIDCREEPLIVAVRPAWDCYGTESPPPPAGERDRPARVSHEVAKRTEIMIERRRRSSRARSPSPRPRYRC